MAQPDDRRDPHQPEGWSGPDPTYGRRALSTKGYVAVVVVPLLIAAALFAIVVWNYDESDVQGETAPVLVSSWLPGAPGGSDQIAGVLTEDEGGCPALGTSEGLLPVAWPGGWSARVSPGGTLAVYDSRDRQVVREGQEIRATGEVVDVGDTTYAGRPCAPESGDLAEIQSEVAVVGG